MDREVRVFVEFAPEIKQLVNNRVDLKSILDESGVSADIDWQALPPTHPEERSKALVETVIITAVSAAAAIRLLESALTHYLDHKSVRDSHYDYWINEPILDGKGKPVLDKQGHPRLIRRRVSGFDDFPDIPGEGIAISVGGKGLSIGTGRKSQSKSGSTKKA